MTRSKIELGDVTPHNIKQLKLLNQVVFPVSYNEKFYKDVLEAGELAKLAYYNDIVVGAVCCRVDTSENSRRLYIMTLGCLYPYRRLGIGTVMVQHVLNYVSDDGNFDSIFLRKYVYTGAKLRNPCGKPGNISSVTNTPSDRSFLANITESSRHGSNSNVYENHFDRR
ncbi:Probable N-acetyltransferase san [Anthophora plagiata]